jgi:deazaflavin-dependent oxidoreductase (nitroreductase family)
MRQRSGVGGSDRYRPLWRASNRLESAALRYLGTSWIALIGRRTVLVLETTGRRTGWRRRTPVAYWRGVGGALFIGGGAGGMSRVDWVANLRANSAAAVWIGRRRRPVIATELSGDAEPGHAVGLAHRRVVGLDGRDQLRIDRPVESRQAEVRGALEHGQVIGLAGQDRARYRSRLRRAHQADNQPTRSMAVDWTGVKSCSCPSTWLARCLAVDEWLERRSGMRTPGPVSGCLITSQSGISVQASKNAVASGMLSQNQVMAASRNT